MAAKYMGFTRGFISPVCPWSDMGGVLLLTGIYKAHLGPRMSLHLLPPWESGGWNLVPPAGFFRFARLRSPGFISMPGLGAKRPEAVRLGNPACRRMDVSNLLGVPWGSFPKAHQFQMHG